MNFRGERRSNATHQSTSDPDARLARIKGKESKLAYHLLTENRHGLVVDARLTQADGYAERRRSPCWRASRRAARWGRIAASTTRIACSAAARSGSRFTWRSTPPSDRAGSTAARLAIRYAVSQRRRKRIEEVFGSRKTAGLLRKTRHRGVDRVGWTFLFTAAAYNLVRMRNLAEAAI